MAPLGTPSNVASLRAAEFPWMDAGDVVYLNSASTGPLPERTRRELDAFNSRRSRPHTISDADQVATLSRARKLVSRVIGATAEEIAISPNTGYGINLAALALPLAPGDVVLVPDLEFPANMYPWMALLARRGAELRVVPTREGIIDEEAVVAALDSPRVKVLSLSWVGFSTGAAVDLANIGRRCRERGIWFVVDAIQGLGALRIDVRETQVDILACGAQKWLLSPWGTGFTYVRRELIEQMEPPVVSWVAVKGSDDFSRLLDYDLTWRDDARRFELVTLPYQDIEGMSASLELLHEFGVDAASARIRSLADRVAAGATAAGRRLVTPTDPARRAGIVSVAVPEPAETSLLLRGSGIVHSLREGAIRFSPHFFNTEDEIDRALELLAR